MFETMLGVILGGLITMAVAIGIEILRKPKLRLELQEPRDAPYPEARPAQVGRALTVACINTPLPYLTRWMSRSAAMQCHGTITFHHLDGQRVFDRVMPIRWSDSPHPGPLEIVIGDQRGFVIGAAGQGQAELVIPEHRGALIDPLRILSEWRADIYPGERASLDVAVRLDNDAECYGWTTANYFSDPPWRNPDWRLATGRYLVHVTVVSASEKCSASFRVCNDQARNDFRLEPALPADLVH